MFSSIDTQTDKVKHIIAYNSAKMCLECFEDIYYRWAKHYIKEKICNFV